MCFSFGLFEAMSAIEMMDPKMDAGMMCNQAKRKVFNLEQAIEVYYYIKQINQSILCVRLIPCGII